jgi:hypothetical protein
MKILTGSNNPQLIPNMVGVVNENGIDPLNALNWSIAGSGLDDYQIKSDLNPIWFGDMIFDTSIIIDASNNMNPSGFMLANAIEVLRQAISDDASEIDAMHSNSFGIIRHSSLHAVSTNNVKFHGKTAGLQFALNHARYNDIIFITGGLSASGPVIVPEGKNIIVWDISGSMTDYSAYAVKTVSNRDPIAAMNEILQYYIIRDETESEKENMATTVVEQVPAGVRIIPNAVDAAWNNAALETYINDPRDHDLVDEAGVSILPQKIKAVTIVVDGSGSMTLVEDYLIGVLKLLPDACAENSVEIMHTFAEGIIIHPSVKSTSILEIEYASGGEGLSFAYANAKYENILLITDGHITDREVTIPEGKNISEWVIKKPNSSPTSYKKYIGDTINDMIEHYNQVMQTRLDPACMGVQAEYAPDIGATVSATANSPDWYITHQWTTNMLAEFSDLSIDQIAKLRRMAINNIFRKDDLDEQLTAMRSLYPYFKTL